MVWLEPKLFAAIQEMKKAISEDRLTYKEIGGFTDNELEGAYACACKYAEIGRIAPH